VARLAFLGSPTAAAVCLDALVRAGHDVVLVVSRADTRRGRGADRSPSPVKRLALHLGVAVTDHLADVTESGAELGVVVAYGRIVPAPVLAVLPMVNVHFSLLPRWRGAAPVERALLAGDEDTGVCLMRLEQGLDTGPVLASQRVPIEPHEHAAALTNRLAVVGARLLVDALVDGVDALAPGDPQQGEPTYAAKIDPDELRLDWSRPAAELERLTRLDRAWTTFRGGRLRVLDARARPRLAGEGPGEAAAGSAPAVPGTMVGTAVVTGAGVLELLDVQPAGKRPMPATAWLQGARPRPGERLGGEEPGR